MNPLMQPAVDLAFATHGVAAVHTRSKTDTSLTLIIEYDLSQWGEALTVRNASAVVSTRETELSDKPRRGDIFTLETGKVLHVESTFSYDGLVWRSAVTI